MWLWVRNRHPKWNPGKWKRGPQPCVVLLFSFTSICLIFLFVFPCCFKRESITTGHGHIFLFFSRGLNHMEVHVPAIQQFHLALGARPLGHAPPHQICPLRRGREVRALAHGLGPAPLRAAQQNRGVPWVAEGSGDMEDLRFAPPV